MVPAADRAVLLATAASSAEAETSRANYTRYSPVDTARTATVRQYMYTHTGNYPDPVNIASRVPQCRH